MLVTKIVSLVWSAWCWTDSFDSRSIRVFAEKKKKKRLVGADTHKTGKWKSLRATPFTDIWSLIHCQYKKSSFEVSFGALPVLIQYIGLLLIPRNINENEHKNWMVLIFLDFVFLILNFTIQLDSQSFSSNMCIVMFIYGCCIKLLSTGARCTLWMTEPDKHGQ